MGRLQEERRWRLYPWAIALGLGVVIAVNSGMIYAALSTFPGIAGSDGFNLSNHYDMVLDRVEQQAELGWTVTAEADAAGHPVVVLSGLPPAALTGATVVATAERPVGDPHTTAIPLTEAAPGRFAGAVALDEKGQWALAIKASAGGHDYVTTRRIVVK